VPGQNEPAPHWVAADARGPQKLPEGHGEGEMELEPQKNPGVQLRAEVNPVRSQYLVAGQDE
jgi:hypothetical protein